MRLYHITEKKNLPDLKRRGLRPKLDRHIDAEGLSAGKIVNLVDKENLDAVWTYFPEEKDYIILEVEVPSSGIEEVFGREDGLMPSFPWYISWKPIAPESIVRVWNPENLLELIRNEESK